MSDIEWLPVEPYRRSTADLVQGAVLRAMVSVPRWAARRIAPSVPPAQGEPLDRRALAFAAVSSRMGVRMVVNGSGPESRQALRAAANGLRGPKLPVAQRATTIAGGGRPIAARFYTPQELAPGHGMLLFAHGGGWAIGDVATYDYAAQFLAHHSHVPVLSIDYRLAPEHPFPAGVDDVVAAFRWSVENADALGVDRSRIGIGGDSAGATLSAVASADLVGDEVRPAFQMLLFPATDLAEKTASRRQLGQNLLLTDPDIDWFYNAYASGQDRTDPRMSPLYRKPSRQLPRTYIATAGYDPLKDEGEEFARRLATAGVDVEHVEHGDLVHGYLSFAGLGGAFRRASLDAARAVRLALA